MMDVNWQALINTIISNFSESQDCPQTVGLLGDVLTHQPNQTTQSLMSRHAVVSFGTYQDGYGVQPHKYSPGANSSFLSSESHLFRQSKKSMEKSLSSQILKKRT